MLVNFFPVTQNNEFSEKYFFGFLFFRLDFVLMGVYYDLACRILGKLFISHSNSFKFELISQFPIL